MRAASKAKAGAAQAPKERVKGTLVKPEFTVKLMEHLGPTAAAKAIGTTPGTLHKARNADTISQPLEVAARGIWYEMGIGGEPARAPARTSDLGEAVLAPTSEGIVTFLVAVPRDKAEMMQGAIKGMGGTIYVRQD